MKTIKEFKDKANKIPVNTNNGWGFGGWTGHEYILSTNDYLFALEDGKNCYRHTSDKHLTYIINGYYVSKEEFLEKLQQLNK